MDATVSGTSEMCAAKDTIFMVGGSEKIYESCKDIFTGMGRESIYMGKSRTGPAI
jgi:3-hydroxyisobutyrate dehydrogenase-like beta-hydroxyacid dehydrogenase